jgi:TRAP-type uncharacterized transport system substrate-binding protein
MVITYGQYMRYYYRICKRIKRAEEKQAQTIAVRLTECNGLVANINKLKKQQQ